MPITVRHDTGDGDISGLAALAALAGSMQSRPLPAPQQVQLPGGLPLPGGGGGGRSRGGGMSSRDKFAMQAAELQAARDMKMQEIDAQSGRDKEAADHAMKVIAVKSGLGQEMQEQEYDMEVKKMQEQAKADANKLEYKISAEGRQELAKINRGKTAVAKALAAGTITEQDAERMNGDLAGQAAGVTPDAMPADPNRIEGIGQMQVGKTGFTYTIEPDGTPKLMQRWDQGPEAAKIKTQETAQIAERVAATKREEKLLDLRAKYATEPVIEGTGENKISRDRTREEVDKLMETISGTAQPAQQQVEQPWWDLEASKDMDIEEGDKEYPPQVGHAKAYMRTWGKNGPAGVPKDKREAYFEAVNILRQYSSQMQAQ